MLRLLDKFSLYRVSCSFPNWTAWEFRNEWKFHGRKKDMKRSFIYKCVPKLEFGNERVRASASLVESLVTSGKISLLT